MGAGCISLTGSGNETSGPGGVFISQDRGEQWQSISFVPTVQGNVNFSHASVYRLQGDPKDPGALYWLSRSNGLLYSYDEGRSWQRSVEPLNQGFIYSLTLSPEDSCVLYATNGRRVYKSTNCSRSWEEVYQEARPNEIVRSVAFNPFDSSEIFILTSSGDLLQSTDAGTSWSTIYRFGMPVIKLEFDQNREDLAYVATREDGLYRSMDGAVSWESLTDNFEKRAGVTEYRGFHVYPTEPNHIYWISKFGILVSRNAGNDWDQIELITPPGSAQIYAFAADPSNDQNLYYTATINAKSTLYRSSDGGKSWITKRLPSAQYPTGLYVHPEEGNWVYLGFTIPKE